MTKDYRITFLGTSAVSASPRVATSACLIELGETRIMVDAGIGALRQLRGTGLSADILDAILITHWHLDHFAGLPGLIRSGERLQPLPIFGPEPPSYVRAVLQVMCPAAIKHFTRVGQNSVLHFADLSVDSFPVSHITPAVGWILAEDSPGNRRLVISGDTRPIDATARAARDVDLLVHEATYLEKHRDKAVRTGHSTAREAATMAVKSGAKRLALTHVSPRYSAAEIAIESRRVFREAVLPMPLSSISI